MIKTNPQFVETYLNRRKKIGYKSIQARIDGELYEALKIIRQAIKLSNYNYQGGRSEGDISGVLNSYINWEQLEIDSNEAKEHILKTYDQTLQSLKTK